MSASAPAAAPRKKSIPFWAQVLLGLAVGVLLGWVARSFGLEWLTTTLSTVGTIFVQLLRVIVVPLVLTALIVSITQLRHVANAARLAIQTLIWFAITALVSVLIGIGLGVLTNPGASASIGTEGAKAVATQGTWLDFLKSLVPVNFLGLEVSSKATEAASGAVSVASSVNFNVLQLVVLGIALGAAALAVGDKAKPFIAITESVLAVFQKLVWWIILLAPYGSAALIGRAVATYGWDLVGPLGVFALDVYLGCALVLFGLYPLLLKLHGLSVGRWFSGAWESITLAFVTRSSVGTLPVTQRNTISLGVPQSYASFAVPLGATTKMDGCAAIYPALAAITVAQLFGIDLTLQHYLLIAFVAVVGSAATAGLTGATVMLTLTLSTLGLPLEGVGLLLAIDPILDMARTATNVAGQSLVPTIVAKRNGILDEDAYYGRIRDEGNGPLVGANA
ncbi:MAG: dicarboxylate/amino acid:cation symporter [Propioniciclava sp.]|uniref:dicarboxylate/amino acid:cation symporter n=1 Tax=Propioniciclava sp. TaxID=2038686 RepID=UPI0039E6571D